MLADSLLLEDWTSVRGRLGLPAHIVTWLDEREAKVRTAMANPTGEAKRFVDAVVGSLGSPTTNAPSTPAQAVHDFYALINGKEFGAAWNRISSRYRSSLHENYGGWVDGFRSTQSVEVVAVSIVTQSADTATVAFTMVSHDDDGAGGTVGKTFQGTWDVVLTDGVWGLDKPHIRQVGG